MARVISYLPTLGTGLPDLAEPGQWQRDDVFALRQLSRALKVGKTNSDFIATTSIPDLWAQPLSFLAVWRDRHHPWFKKVRAEWRGMLAVLGLAEVLGLDLKVIDLNLAELRQHPWAAGHQAAPGMNRNLMQILAEFCPNLQLSNRQSWTRLGLIATREYKPLALVVPTIFVAPAREYYRFLPKLVSWRDPDSGRLIDPVASGLTAAKAIALAAYLDHVSRRFNALPTELGGELDNELYGLLREALAEYVSDVSQHAAVAGTHVQDSFTVGALAARAGNIPFAFVTQAVVPPTTDSRPGFPSDALLPARSEIAGIKGAVVVHPEIATMLQKASDDFRILDPYSLTDFLQSKAIESTVIQRAQSAGYEVLKSDDLFTDLFTEVEYADAPAHPRSAAECLLPLRAEVLRFVKPDELRAGLRITREYGNVTVELDLPLRDRSGNEIRYTASKTYSGEQIRRVQLPGALVTWPDFVSDQWKRHFIFYYAERTSPRPRLAISPRLFAQASQGSGASPVKYQAMGGAEVGIFSLDHRAEALSCEVQDAGGSMQEAGLLLLGSVSAVSAQDEPREIAVDFGTTNTSIHSLRRTGALASPQPMSFLPRLTHPIGRSEFTNALLQDRFLRTREEKDGKPVPTRIPFLSMLEEPKEMSQAGQLLDPDAQSGQQVQVAPLVRQRVHYVRNVSSTLTDLAEANSNIRFALKWSEGPKQRKWLEAYLGQVCMQSLAELVARGADPRRVTWLFSEPGSFSASHAQAFTEICRRATAWACGVEEAASMPAPQMRLESEAAALYFVRHPDQQVGFGRTVFTLDIGGQTTDICLWHDQRLLWQTSVRFAGQHILIDYLKYHPEARSQVMTGPARDNILQQLRALDGSVDDPTMTQALEVAVNSDLFDAELEISQLPGLQKVAQLGLAGLLFYLGMVVQHLLRETKYLTPPLQDVRFCLGGRGSLIFKSVVAHRTLYRSYFSQVSQLQLANLSFHMSRDPKHEVSFGMLVPREGAGEFVVDDTYDRCILGETIAVGAEAKDGLDVLATQDLDKPWSVLSLPRFEEFLNVYAKTFQHPVALNDEERHDLINRVESEVRDLRSGLRKDREQLVDRVGSAEPVFISPLRTFVRTMIRAGEAGE